MKTLRVLTFATALLFAGACESLDDPAGSIAGVAPAFLAATETTCFTITFDDLGLGHGDQVTTIPTPLGNLAVTVTPFGEHSTANAVLYNTNHVDGPDYDLEWGGALGDCPDCQGLGKILVIQDSRGFALEGDSDTGGIIRLTGFPAGSNAFVKSFVALDQESSEASIRLFEDAVLVGQSTAQGNGSVEHVDASTETIDQGAAFVIGGSGGVDNVVVCASTPVAAPESLPGRMTGGGGQLRVDGLNITRGFTIHCDIKLSNNIEVNWNGNSWHIAKPLTGATCLDDPNIDPTPPKAPFDTFIGEGTGRLNGQDGSVIRFTFVDAGEPGRNDTAHIRIWAPGDDPDTDTPVLEVAGALDHGNIQAHYDQPHGNNWNR